MSKLHRNICILIFILTSAYSVLACPSGTLGSGTEADPCQLTSCEILDESNIFHVLQNDISGIINNCFPITGNNINLDLNNHKLTGTQIDHAIYVIDSDYVTVKNGIIENFDLAIQIDRCSYSNLTNLVVNLSLTDNIWIGYTNNSMFKNIISSRGGNDGLDFHFDSYNNTVINLTVSNNIDDGVQIRDSDNNTFRDINSFNNGNDGVVIENSNQNIIKNSIIKNNGDDGISLEYSDNNILENLNIHSNAFGLYSYDGSKENIILNTNISQNTKEIWHTDNYKNFLIYNNSFGEIKWHEVYGKLEGDLTFPGNIKIEHNLAHVKTEEFTVGNIDSPSNITLNQITGFTNPAVLKDGSECATCTLTSFLNQTAIFTVQGWTDYSIGEGCTDSDSDNYATEGGPCGEIDCDDAVSSTNPGAVEICDDGIDNNCNSIIDEGCTYDENKDYSKILIRTERIVYYNGEPIRLILDTFVK